MLNLDSAGTSWKDKYLLMDKEENYCMKSVSVILLEKPGSVKGVSFVKGLHLHLTNHSKV